MRIDIEPARDKKLRIIKASHLSEEIMFSIPTYEKTEYTSNELFFGEINAYFEYIPNEQKDNIWAIFKDIESVFENVTNPHRLHIRLQDLVRQLYDIITLESVREWLRSTGHHINLPGELDREYRPNQTKHRKREMTYLRNEYYDLVVMSIQLKPAVPIFGEYIRRLAKTVGTNFKESEALKIFAQSQLIRSEPMKRLKQYIEASVEKEDHRQSAVMGGLGTAELPDWLLAKIVVRRVAIYEANYPGNNIASIVYNTVDQMIKSMDRNFKGKINPKKAYGGAVEEDNISVVEGIKVKQKITDGDVKSLSVYADGIFGGDLCVAQSVDPTVDPAKVSACVDLHLTPPHVNTKTHHEVLCQWVMSKVISPGGIPQLDPIPYMKMLGITQALLWHWGFLDLALLMAGEETESEEMDLFETADARSRLTKAYVEKLMSLYPYYQTRGANREATRQNNVTYAAIDIISKDLVQHDWTIKGPVALLNETDGANKEITLIVPANIRFQLADLIIKIAEGI